MLEKSHSVNHASGVSMEKIIESLRQERDARISGLMKEQTLLSFLEEHFDTIAISPVKLEFLKRDLKELKKSSLDLAHYSSLIKHMKEVNTEVADGTHSLFVSELKAIFQKYGF